MKSKIFIAAALAAGAMTVASHAQDGSWKSDGAEAGPVLVASFPPLSKNAARGKTAAGEDTQSRSASPEGKAAAEQAQGGVPYHAIVLHYAKRYGVPVPLAHAVIRVESNYRPTARGRAGEIGLMQIKPDTARIMGYRGSVKELYRPETNIKFGMKYLGEAFRLGGGQTCSAILKYNAGHGAKRMNPISAAYCAKVKRLLSAR